MNWFQKRSIALIYQSLIFCAGAVLLALIFNAISPNGISLKTQIRSVQVRDQVLKIPIWAKAASDTEEAGFVFHPAQEIRLPAAFAAFQKGQAIFIDTRSTEKYLDGHIAGALSFPLEEREVFEFEELQLQRDQKIVTYCDGEACSQSIDLAMQLEEMGYFDIYFFLGGWLEWQKANYPIMKGERP